MDKPISIAIETSSRQGSVALGAGEGLLAELDFAADQRHAVQVISRLDELLAGSGLRPADVDEVYVSIGPGSFTGVRVGITVARTLAQAVPKIRLAAVPTVSAVARNAAGVEFENLAVVMDAKEETVYTACFGRSAGGDIEPSRPAELVNLADLPGWLPKPVVLIGEALLYHPVSGEGVTPAPPELYYPKAKSVWEIGRQLARRGEFTSIPDLRPLYLRRPEAVRLWEKLHGQE